MGDERGQSGPRYRKVLTAHPFDLAESQKRVDQLTSESQTQGPGQDSGWLSKLETLSILYIAVFLTRIGFGVILVLFPLYLPIPKTQSALAAGVTAIYPIVEGISALPVGAYVDRKGRRKVVVAGLGGFSKPKLSGRRFHKPSLLGG